MVKIIIVAGARPNFMKIASLKREFDKYLHIESIIVHTGQHYDKNMSDNFFSALDIPSPDINLKVGSGSHAYQTAEIMKKFEKAINDLGKVDLVIVVGDVNSTIACALVAVKKGIKIAHIESGLRSFDRSMPEEINRILTDQISEYLFCSCEEAVINLKSEGIDSKKIFFVGNIMIDSLFYVINKYKIKKKKKKNNRKIAVLTLHRPSNVDKKENLIKIFNILKKSLVDFDITFSCHPRTLSKIKRFGLLKEVSFMKLVSAMKYVDFIKLLITADVVFTDSGGIQEETTVLGIPCVTLRENTERSITITQGTNILTGLSKLKINKVISDIFYNKNKKIKKIRYWDGNTARRIMKIINKKLIIND